MGLVAKIVWGRRGFCSPGYKQLFGFKNRIRIPLNWPLGLFRLRRCGVPGSCEPGALCVEGCRLRDVSGL